MHGAMECMLETSLSEEKKKTNSSELKKGMSSSLGKVRFPSSRILRLAKKPDFQDQL